MTRVRACSRDDRWEDEMREVWISGRRVLLVHAEGGRLSALAEAEPALP